MVTTPKVVRGVTMIPADPNVDPTMPRTSDGLDYTTRSIDPPPCNPSK